MGIVALALTGVMTKRAYVRMNGTEQSADGVMAGREGPLNRSGLRAGGLAERPGLA